MPALPVAVPAVPTPTVVTNEIIQRAIALREGRITSYEVPPQKTFTKMTAEQIIAAAAKANSPTGTHASEQQQVDPRVLMIVNARRKAQNLPPLKSLAELKVSSFPRSAWREPGCAAPAP